MLHRVVVRAAPLMVHFLSVIIVDTLASALFLPLHESSGGFFAFNPKIVMTRALALKAHKAPAHFQLCPSLVKYSCSVHPGGRRQKYHAANRDQ